MEEDEARSNQASLAQRERIRLIKEERRKHHEERLGKSNVLENRVLDDSNTLKRFSKYRRSDRGRNRKDGTATSTATAEEDLFQGPEDFSVQFSLENFSNCENYISAHSDSPCYLVSSNSGRSSSSSNSPLMSSLSLEQGRGVMKRPSIPPILRSATEPASSVSDEDSVAVKKPSILKKKEDFSASSCSSSHAASVSFGLPVSTTVLTRTKSIDSHISGEVETGYWSGSESAGGILKSRRSFESDSEHSSILKDRRSSLGSTSVPASTSDGGLQSILKRKLSYDSSHIAREARCNEYSFSTRSLPSCGCLSPEPKPILKKKSSSEDLEETEPKPILKKGGHRDSHESSSDGEKIKPCLKKSSSKSTDDGFPSSSSLNFSSSSFSTSVSPVSGISNTEISGSSCNKGILKKDNKLCWRESSSASSSSSSDIDNLRTCHSLDPDTDRSKSTKGNANFELSFSKRFFSSEGDIHENEKLSNYSVCDILRFKNEKSRPDSSLNIGEIKEMSMLHNHEDIMLSPEGDASVSQPTGLMNKNAIAERIAALQTSGEVNWKKRIGKLDKQPENIAPTDQNDNVELRKNNKESSVVANRLSQLEISKDTWKKRVGETDATIFTVQGRLEKAGKIKNGTGPGVVSAEVKEKLQKVVTPLGSQRQRKLNKCQDSSTTASSISSADKCLPSSAQAIETCQETKKQLMSTSGIHQDSLSSDDKVIRRVHRNDSETFDTFFTGHVYNETGSAERIIDIDEAVFSELEGNREKLIGLRKQVKAPRKHATRNNPIKNLALRLAEQDQVYEELSASEREKRIKTRFPGENMSKNAHLSADALAGLASTEDFTSVKLKKSTSEIVSKREYPTTILLRIKGKRQVQTRVVAPNVNSLDSGDNYVLVTSDKIYQLLGEYSNRLERAKIADVVANIVHKKDLGCRAIGISHVLTLDESVLTKKLLSPDGMQFLEILGGESIPESDQLGDEADETYESEIVKTNRVYQVDDKTGDLIPLIESSGWQNQPRFSILDEEKVLVFDFGSEVYVWSGAKADADLKKAGYKAAVDLFEAGFDYEGIVSKCHSPVTGTLKSNARPTWCFVKRVNQHMEPILFIEKFFDWPDDSARLIKVQQQKKPLFLAREGSYNFESCDPEEMLESLACCGDPDLDLEMFNIGRGTIVRNEEDRRTWTINTKCVTVWNMSEFSTAEVEEKHIGQFYSAETYVIRWQFSATQIGRDLKGNASKHGGILGRDRNTYFFWHGKHSKITEQGTSALMTVELDREKGPQIRLEEGQEPPAFLNLFHGLMFVHLNTKDSPLRDTKLYVAAGALENEGHFIEISSEANDFRSLGSYMLVDFLKGRLYLWHGRLSNDVTRKIATNGAEHSVKDPLTYLNFHGSLRLIQIEEGEETQAFLCCVKMHTGKDISDSLLSFKDSNREDFANMTVFSFTSLKGSFEAQPWVSCKRKSDSPEAFPMWQEDLYKASQPCMFLVTRGPISWLWQGWIPRGDVENSNTFTGSGEIRWAAERRAALETAAKFVDRVGTKGYLIFAGYEPNQFQNLFPMWEFNQEVFEANQAEERTPGLMVELEDALKIFRKTTYTMEELQERPEGVDQSRLESYLADEEFERILNMTREEFNKLQSWKQTDIKKNVGLF